jgi:hypothetical protein
MKLTLSTLTLGAAILLAVAGPAFSQTTLIDVDIGIGAVQTGAAVLGSAGDVWNGFTGNTATVINSAGTPLSGVGFTMTGQAGVNANNTAGTAMDAATTPLMQDYAYLTAAGTITVSLTGLTAYKGYPFTLVVYAAGDTASPSQGASLAVTAGATGGNTASTLTTSGNPDRKLSDGPGVAYNTFTGTLGNGTLIFTATRLPGSTYLGWNGFQLLLSPSVPPIITSEPVTQTNYLGQTTSFSVTAAGIGTLSYQWQATNSASGGFTNLVNGGAIFGATNNVLTITGVTVNQALAYQVIVTNASGSVTSTPATLTILPGSPLIRIMPLGDSITRGATDPNVEQNLNLCSGYRDALYTLNTNANMNFQFVGSTATQESPQLISAGQQYHNGYASYTTGSLLTNLTANVQPTVGDSNVGGYWMTSGSPGGMPVLEDVVTLLTGANDIGQNPNNSLQYFTNNEINLLGWFKTNRPNTKVIVATDPPRTDSTANNSAALAINQWITNNVPTLSSNFSTVDLYHLFIDTNGNIKTSSSPDGVCLQDGVHPSHNGYEAMGQVWFNAIQGVMNPTAPNYLSAIAGINSQVTLAWTNVPGALGYNVKMSTTNGGPYSLIASNLNSTTFTNNGLVNGTAYYYVVSAVSGGGEGANSYQVNATPGTIPVFNHSFDNNYVAYANYIPSAPAGWTFTGSGSGQFAAVVFPASGDGRFASYPVPGLDGLDYAQIFVNGTGAGTLYINTGYSYAAGATYKLTAGFGIETGGGTLAPGAEMLLQNTSFTTFASTNITSANTTANQFKDVSTTYTANGTEGNIVISFAIPATVTGPDSFDFDNVRLSVVYPGAPTITSPPVSQTNSAGNNVTFSVTATGAAPLSYQWQASGGTGFTNLVNGGSISGVGTNVLAIANVTTNWALAYRVIITNSFGSVTSTVANLTVLTVPVITSQPVSQTQVAGSLASFSATAVGPAPLSYQWQASGGTGYTNLVNGGNISGVNTNVLTIGNVGSNWALAYRVVAANSYGSVTSAVANLTVLPFVAPPNAPGSGVMGPALAANVGGSYSSPPANLPTSAVTRAPVTGNGDMAITVGGASSALQFYVGNADFWGVLRGAIMPVGSLTLSAPALSGSSYALNQNVGPATVTGNFVNGSSGLSVTSWVASAENTAVIQLNNTGTSPLSLSSQLLDGFAGSAGNPATYGVTNNSTWLSVSPDTVYLELGNQLHNLSGTAPFTGKIADLRLYNQALTGSTLANLDGNGVPTPLLRWSTTNQGTAALVGKASLNLGDPHGGSVTVASGSDEVAVGDLPLPERQFTVSAWVNVASTSVNGNIVTAQVPYIDPYAPSFPYPYTRGLTLNLANGVLSASLNQSGYLDFGSPYLTFATDSPNHFMTTASSALPTNQWIQAQVTYDGNTLTLYTNGVQVGTPVTFPTGLPNGMFGWNKMVTHLGDTDVIYNACAPQGVLMQSVVGATATTNSQGALTFTIPSGGQVTIALAAVTDRNNTNYFAAAQQQSQQATTASLTNLFLAHSVWWNNFWTKSYVQIPDQIIQNNWYGSLYLLACCSTSNSPAPGLWGNFISSTQPEFEGDYTLDYNYEGPFWGALACNHAELADNYDKPLLDQISRGKATAQYVLGITNGIQFYCHLVPAPGWSDDPGSFWGQKSDALFAAVNCAMRWKYTQDTNYAAKVYPYLKGVAGFWNQYLTLSGGQYVDINDSAWEQSGADNNPSTTLAFIQLVYPALVQMSQALNADASSRAQWNSIIANLAPLTIVPASSIGSLNALGAPYNNPGVNVIRASSSGTDFPKPAVTLYQDHQLRNSSAGMGPCQVIYPGWNIGLESSAATLLAASNTVWLAAQWYDNNNMCNFYPDAACAGYDPNQILSILDTMLTYYQYPNFMEDPGGGGTENYSIVPATLASMFLQSYQTNVHVFADWPSNQSAAFGNLNACGGFLVSGAITLGSANYVQVQSTAGQLLKLANPWPGAAVQCVSSLTGISTLSGSVLNYQTQVGEVLTLTSTGVTNLPAPANLTGSLIGGSAALTWNAVPGAGGYNVKRATSVGGPYLNVTSGLTATNYTDASLTGHTTYYYAVTALAPGFESTNSAVVTVTPPVIANWSFEAQSVATNSYAIENPTSWSMAGQSGGATVAIVHPGPNDGRFGLGHVPMGMDGSNYCQLYMNGAGSATVYQDLGSANPYQAGTTYTLAAAFGLEAGNFPTGTLVLYNSALTPLATKTITSAMLTTNAFTSYSLNYTATGNEGGNGDIVVGFGTTGAASGTSFDVDNVRLTQVAPVSTNAYLTSLTLNPVLSFTPAFSSSTFSYTATAAYGSSPTVTVADANGNATNQLIYNGATNVLASGVASAALTLNPNLAVTNVIQVQVTAQDGVTKQTYTVNVTQPPSQTKPVLTSSASNGTLTLTWPVDHLGYRLLTQTNNLNLGVSANLNDWATVPGSTTTNLINLPITTTNLNSFYRLVFP